MLKFLPTVVLFIYCIFSFFREIKLDHLRYMEQDRLGDEHMMREIEKFLREQEQAKQILQIDRNAEKQT